MFKKKTILVKQGPNSHYFEFHFPFSLWWSFKKMSTTRKGSQRPEGLKQSVYWLTRKIISTGVVKAVFVSQDHLGFSIKVPDTKINSAQEQIEEMILSHFFLGRLRFRFEHVRVSFSYLNEARHLNPRRG